MFVGDIEPIQQPSKEVLAAVYSKQKPPPKSFRYMVMTLMVLTEWLKAVK
jgi:hypothetical protein